MTYSQKLMDPRWQKKRLQVFERDGWRCLVCGNAEETLHVHHLAYNGEPWDAELQDLETLCATCHETRTESDKWLVWQLRHASSRRMLPLYDAIEAYQKRPDRKLLEVWAEATARAAEEQEA